MENKTIVPFIVLINKKRENKEIELNNNSLKKGLI